MEESEKRRQRLKALRMEAADGGANAEPGVSGSPLHGLSNPLIETENVPLAPSHQGSRRFDYYTDPTSAFYGRQEATNAYPRGQYSNNPRAPNQAMAPTPSYQYPSFNSPGAHPQQVYPRSSSPYQAMGPSATYQNQAFRSPGAVMSQVPVAHPRHAYPGSTIEPRSSWSAAPVRPHTPPAGQRSAFNYRWPSNSPQGVNFVRARQRQDNSPYTTYGRGMNQRGRTGPNDRSILAKERPDLYYNRGMVEDPWKNLIPVLWKGPWPGTDGSWMPKSITAKKAKVSPESSKISLPQGSLAQYLAEAFNDPSEETVDD